MEMDPILEIYYMYILKFNTRILVYFMPLYILHPYNYGPYKALKLIQARSIILESMEKGTDLPKHLNKQKEKKKFG